MLPAQLGNRNVIIRLLDEPDDLLGSESTLLHVRLLGVTDFTATSGTAQWGQVKRPMPAECKSPGRRRTSAASNSRISEAELLFLN